MSSKEHGQGAELRPSLPKRKQVSLFSGKPLKPDGYLFKKQLSADLAQAHNLGKPIQARREGAMKDYVAPEKYLTLCKDLQERTERKTLQMEEADLQPAGHDLTVSESWPRVEQTGHLRLMHANVHGFNHANNNMECDYFIQQMAQHQVDVPMVVEVNQPLANGAVRANLTQCVKHFDKHAKVLYGYPDEPTTKRGWQMGGLMSYLQGGASGLLNDYGHDECGRWSWITLGQCNLCLISAYRVGPGTDGINTIRAMEMRHLMRQKHRYAKTPRKAFDTDMTAMIKKHKDRGHPVLLLMDANTDFNSTEMKKFMKATGLKNIFTTLHPMTSPPRTYDRGKSCLDMALGCDDAIELVKAIGYLPFYELGPDDHRAMFLDLYYDKLKAKSCMEDVTRSHHEIPSLRRPAEVKRFIERYKSMVEKANLFEKVEGIRKRFLVASPTERIFLEQRLNKYDKVWVQLALSAVKSTGSKVKGLKGWSPIFAHKGAICRYWNQRLRIFHTTGKLEPMNRLRLPTKYVPAKITCEEDLHAQHAIALQDWHLAKGNAAEFRKQHLEDLIQFHSERRDLKRETAVKQILHWEEMRNLHERQSRMMTSSKPNVIRTLLVPRPHSKDPTALMEIQNPDHIQQVILKRNASKLGAAHGSLFTVPPLSEIFGPHGETKVADDVANGRFDVSTVDEWKDVKYKRELKLFLHHLQRPRNEDGTSIEDMKWDYGPDEFRETFSKKREDTSCGPSGITMQFYRIFCLDDDLANFHATFICLPFKYGFSLQRWQNSVHFMLMKLEVPLWEKLRIIQLMEGDFNGGLRYLFGRKLMHFSIVKQISSDATYGGRPGRSCHDALLRIQLAMEYCRHSRTLAAFMDIDATACFDNQIRNLIGLNTRRLGADKNMAQCQTETLEKMEHRVKITHGVSKSCIRHTKETPLYGSGQGSGAGVINWHGHNETLVAMYEETQPGCLMTSPDKKTEQDQQVISFVDDNKLCQSFRAGTECKAALKSCTRSINFWRKSLEVTGGALNSDKCGIQMLVFDFDTYSYRQNYPHRSTPLMVAADQQEGDCLMFDEKLDDYKVIKKLNPSHGRKLLGVRLAANGTCRDEFQARKAQSEKLAAQLARSGATPVDAYMIYVFRYCPAVFYCIPITYFTKAQCRQIQAPFITELLPKLRLNRHVKRDIIWGPTKFGGLNLKHMETEQIAKTVESLIGHVRAESPTGNTFLIACETYQMLLGIQHPFFMIEPEWCPHRPPSETSKITYIWEALQPIKGLIVLSKMWTPPKKDIPCIMDVVLNTKHRSKGTVKFITDETVRMVNACRLWLRALHIDDLMNEDGMIDNELFWGRRKCDTELLFPHQERPPEWVWDVWRRTLHQVCIVRNGTNDQLAYIPTAVRPLLEIPSMKLPETLDNCLPLKEMVASLPIPYQKILGDITYPSDDGAALAQAILDGSVNIFTDGTVQEGCGAHAYTVRTASDKEEEAVSGAAPTWGDPETISSLRTEHFGVLAALVWVWMIMQKHGIDEGTLEGAVDNMTVVNRVNDGREATEGAAMNTVTDKDVWDETLHLLQRMRLSCNLRHVKGHQDNMHKKGIQGPLMRDAYWNVEMDKRAEQARLMVPSPSAFVFASSLADFVLEGQPIHTKISKKIKTAFLGEPLRKYIQQKEDWEDGTFDSVDWKAYEATMNKLTIHKRINVAKYVFNWQNTGRQKQLFEDSRAEVEDRQPECVGQCPMQCGEFEAPQHFLRCKILHDAKLMTRNFYSIRKWLREQKTCPEMRVVLEKGMMHWMQTGLHIDIWDLQESDYRDTLEDAIKAQNYIGWHNIFKGRLATEWGKIQMQYYEEVYEDELPKHISATWWASEFIRQLLYFSLAMWQHRNVYLHNTVEQKKKIEERTAAVEEMATWYERKREFPSEDKLNFSRSFLERCTDTTAQIRLWLGKIVDIHNYNMQTTLRGYFTTAD